MPEPMLTPPPLPPPRQPIRTMPALKGLVASAVTMAVGFGLCTATMAMSHGSLTMAGVVLFFAGMIGVAVCAIWLVVVALINGSR